jgi:hypothetical protein
LAGQHLIESSKKIAREMAEAKANGVDPPDSAAQKELCLRVCNVYEEMPLSLQQFTFHESQHTQGFIAPLTFPNLVRH